MKFNVVFFIGIFLIPLLSCEEKSDTSIVETNANLKIDIPLETEIISTDVIYSFWGTNSYIITGVDNQGKEILNITKIETNDGSILSVPGFKNGNKINTLTLEWGEKSMESEDYIMHDPIDLLVYDYKVENEVFSIKLDEAIISLVKNINNLQNKSILVRLNGTSNFEIKGNANIDVPVKVESEEYNVRFELF